MAGLIPIVISVNTSQKKGIPKTAVDKIVLVKNHGIKNDAHAGPGIRQVSFIAQESYDKFKQSNQDKACIKILEHGSFGENIVTQGIILHKLKLGTRLKINDTILEISKIGKECHAPCIIGQTTGQCIMPTEGVFAIVIKGGTIKKGQLIY